MGRTQNEGSGAKLLSRQLFRDPLLMLPNIPSKKSGAGSGGPENFPSTDQKDRWTGGGAGGSFPPSIRGGPDHPPFRTKSALTPHTGDGVLSGFSDDRTPKGDRAAGQPAPSRAAGPPAQALTPQRAKGLAGTALPGAKPFPSFRRLRRHRAPLAIIHP